jgi:hypothetical protein
MLLGALVAFAASAVLAWRFHEARDTKTSAGGAASGD